MDKTTNYKFFAHKECEYFPCHNVKNIEDFNCLFCYCPLYALGDKCGGNFTYTKDGVKNCTNCTIPHKRQNYDYMVEKLKELIDMTRKKDQSNDET